ncbi:MAG: hypothetical protein A3F47_00550 [Candidatus Staskawiczbacteria bacterium RIFCSPHIGHO2_12_FULL_38_11]|uniref:Uncharacterized protein n=1 Tax=Candidatus Staskawiczbacteria bacterium RIFCSPHIGHO2_12_FULL_38_11 TaxID=1802209 RepID=A0A1G2IA94_9BACT|nr:MAG: hypothetical protein A3F47_00550 [Candidatus Staskawiczbacteria bacterium RIFCSPHIGHO2_12_FULL_38_11]
MRPSEFGFIGGYSRAHGSIGNFLFFIRQKNKENQAVTAARVNKNFAWISSIETGRRKVLASNIGEVITAYQLTTKEIQQLKNMTNLGRVKMLTEEDWLFERIIKLSPTRRRSLIKRLRALN